MVATPMDASPPLNCLFFLLRMGVFDCTQVSGLLLDSKEEGWWILEYWRLRHPFHSSHLSSELIMWGGERKFIEARNHNRLARPLGCKYAGLQRCSGAEKLMHVVVRLT